MPAFSSIAFLNSSFTLRTPCDFTTLKRGILFFYEMSGLSLLFSLMADLFFLKASCKEQNHLVIGKAT